ncbi:hypothetical protein RhiirC2_820358 [Rhizophagus irregularis]|uniref:CCHC-type domain-containing protein n=1 Tax=Rhizophagus irregularis TaxID=588596 RepID=A0A2N1MDI8_9GLOM|nr:hypothetical protein RhiirC2_820358 [Rhizophagus irregularis]
MTANRWNDAQKLQVVPAYLKGPAAIWYQAAVLAPINAWAAAANTNNFQHAFLTRFWTAAMVEMWATEDQTLADAIGRAKGCELTLRSGKMKLLNYAGQTTSEITELTKLVAPLTEQITEIGKKVTGNRPPPRSDSRNPNAPSGPNRPIVCYTCGEPGHVSRRSQMRRAEPYPRPVVSEEKEPLQPIDIPTAPLDTPKTVELMIVTKTAETSSKAIERTTVNIAAKKKKVSVVKKKKKVNLQPLISLHVPPYLMVDDIKNQQARITFRQLLEVALKCHSELIRGIRKPTVQKMNLGEVLNFPITIQDITVPINVVVTEAESYAAIVGNDWLSKVRANIEYESSTMNLTWNKQTIGVPVEYRLMPQEKRKLQGLIDSSS